MPNLFPDSYDEEILLAEDVAQSESDTGYAPGALFSDGDLQRDGQYQVVEASGLEAWEQWCVKATLTERYSSPIYTTDVGVEYQQAMKAETHDKAESILNKNINEALMADPRGRTKYVEEISFSWIAPNAVQISVKVVGIDNATIDFSFVAGGGEDGVRVARIS